MPTPTAYAGFWLRAGAMMIDSLVLTVILVGGTFGLGMLGVIATDGTQIAVGIVVYYLLGVIGSWLYFALQESSESQATLGKRAVGLIVTDMQGQRISFGRALGRLLAKMLNQLSIGIGWMMAGFTEHKQGLHDMVARTLVVKRDPSRSSAWVVVLAVVFVTLPFAGVVAAIAIPGLLRARMSGNEAAAIATMRTITSAQLSYFARCDGYAPSLTALASENILGDELVTATEASKSGYTFSIRAADAATAVPDVPAGCEGAVSDYSARGEPISPGATGSRYFSTDGSSTILQDTSGAFARAIPID